MRNFHIKENWVWDQILLKYDFLLLHTGHLLRSSHYECIRWRSFLETRHVHSIIIYIFITYSVHRKNTGVSGGKVLVMYSGRLIYGYIPLVVSTSRSFPHSWIITIFVTRVTRRVPLEGQELLSSLVLVGFVFLVLSFSVYCFVDCCLSFCTFSFGHCAVCPSLTYEL